MSDPIEEALTRWVPDGFRDEDGVWHDGPHRAAALEALAVLRGRLADEEAVAAGRGKREIHWRERAEAAEASVVSLREALRDKDAEIRDMTTAPTGEGAAELLKARTGKGLTATETLIALRAAMEVADRAKERGKEAESLLSEWLEFGYLSTGGMYGTLESRTRAALASSEEGDDARL